MQGPGGLLAYSSAARSAASAVIGSRLETSSDGGQWNWGCKLLATDTAMRDARAGHIPATKMISAIGRGLEVVSPEISDAI